MITNINFGNKSFSVALSTNILRIATIMKKALCKFTLLFCLPLFRFLVYNKKHNVMSVNFMNKKSSFIGFHHRTIKKWDFHL